MGSLLSETAAPPRLTFAGVADAVTAAHWRGELRRWLKHVVQAPAVTREDILLGVGEALANCVEHAYRTHHEAGTMKLQVSYDPAMGSVRVCVSDRGNWQRPSLRKPHDPRASRGIMLMRTLADHCTINARPNGTSVYLDYAIDPRRLGKQSGAPQAKRSAVPMV